MGDNLSGATRIDRIVLEGHFTRRYQFLPIVTAHSPARQEVQREAYSKRRGPRTIRSEPHGVRRISADVLHRLYGTGCKASGEVSVESM